MILYADIILETVHFELVHTFLVLASDKCAFTKCRFKVQFLFIFSRSMLILVEFFSMYIYKPMRDACYAEVYCVEKLGAKLESYSLSGEQSSELCKFVHTYFLANEQVFLLKPDEIPLTLEHGVN
jgi:hypothetical protein